MMGGLCDQSKHWTFEKKRDVTGVIKSPCLHLNARDFLHTKAKCPLGGRRQCSSGSAVIWSKKMPFLFATGKPPNTDYKPEGQ